ncbi:hypothetical protein [Shewanella sp. CG12_big_fil_rev_8_21_14_0_65_47_15]|uniref:hypothetical protein n=1 Tax=Shewanella sp. CG12_big_fil_rev_8_21_14_0_65_47_15 TaxID=1975537 RepID=UPI0025FBA91B|nr:hypothetical protein [Shewanella sp. CG12_big_fil_rev_8_21_14_0_65_47_15]
MQLAVNTGKATVLATVMPMTMTFIPMAAKVQSRLAVDADRGISAEEKNTFIAQVLLPVHSSSEVKEVGAQVSVLSSQEESPRLMTRMECFGVGAKLAALGAGQMPMIVQPVLPSSMLHYQIAPEYFTQYVQLNTYRVFFRNKYYVFQFEDHKVTNFLEDYYDRH